MIKKVPPVMSKSVTGREKKRKRRLVSNGTGTAASIPILPLICLHGARLPLSHTDLKLQTVFFCF